MDIKGKITIFPELKERENEKGELEKFIVCRGTLSSGNKKDGYVNKSVGVVFAGSNFPREKVNKLNPDCCYKLEIEEGFLGVREITSPSGSRKEIELVVLKGKLSDKKEVERPVVEEKPADDDLPF